MLESENSLKIYSNVQNNYIDYNLFINFNNTDLVDNPISVNDKLLSNGVIFDDFREIDANLPQENFIVENFLFLRQSTITSFFSVNLVDMPLCFKKSKSLYSKTFELPLLKFINLIMRRGFREKVLKSLTLSFSTFFKKYLNNFDLNLNRWLSIFTFLSTTCTSIDSVDFCWSNSLLCKPITLNSRHSLSEAGYTFNNSFSFKNNLFSKLSEYNPLFSFYIRKVDKSIRKNSRGKSGKYTIIWKYVPLYKRLYVTMRWFLKDLKFQKLKTFDERLFKTLEVFFLSPNLSFISKLRKFTHFFVFQNHKKTLLKTLKSTS